MSAVKVFRVRAALHLPSPQAVLLAFVLLVIQKMTNNPHFTNPGTLITALAAAVATFQTAVDNVSTAKDVVAARTAARQAVVDCLLQVLAYINSVVATLPPDQATAAVESSGLRAKKRSTYAKLPLEIKYGGLPGAVVLVALAAAKSAIYYFEYSADGKTWLACPISMKCKVALSGLTIGTIYSFRVHAQTRKGLTDLTSVVTFVVR